MYWVYVIKGEKGIFYKGFTNNLERRLMEHANGKTETTRRMGKLELVFVQVCDTRAEARELEKYLKSGIGREIIKNI